MYGYNTRKLSGLNDIKCDSIVCTYDISSNTIDQTPTPYYAGLTNNIQNQFNTINSSMTTITNNYSNFLTTAQGQGYTTQFNSISGIENIMQLEINTISANVFNNYNTISTLVGTLIYGLSFSATISTPYTQTASTSTTVQYDGIEFNIGSYYNTSTYKFTPPQGYYLIHGSIRYTASTQNGYFLYLYKNGGAFKNGVSAGSSVSLILTVSVSTIVYANGTDSFWLVGSSNTSQNLLNTVGSFFQGCKINGSNGVDGINGTNGTNGITPSFSVGTLTSLSYGSLPTLSITGTSLSPTLNFGIPLGATGNTGNTGNTGQTGATPSFSVGTLTSLSYGSPPTLTITGTSASPVFNLGVPIGATGGTGNVGQTGNTGATPVFAVGTTSSLGYGVSPTVTITGTSAYPYLNLGIPQGGTPSFSVGTTSSLGYGVSPTVTISGTSLNPILNLGIPQGGTPSFSVGTLSSLIYTSKPIISITGTTLSPTLNFSIPVGATGNTGATPSFSIGAQTNLSYGNPPIITLSGTVTNPILNFSIPVGANGVTPYFTIGNVTTLGYGVSPTVSISGTATNPVLNMGIPSGASITGYAQLGVAQSFTATQTFNIDLNLLGNFNSIPVSYFTGLNSNIQTQFNTLSSTIYNNYNTLSSTLYNNYNTLSSTLYYDHLYTVNYLNSISSTIYSNYSFFTNYDNSLQLQVNNNFITVSSWIKTIQTISGPMGPMGPQGPQGPQGNTPDVTAAGVLGAFGATLGAAGAIAGLLSVFGLLNAAADILALQLRLTTDEGYIQTNKDNITALSTTVGNNENAFTNAAGLLGCTLDTGVSQTYYSNYTIAKCNFLIDSNDYNHFSGLNTYINGLTGMIQAGGLTLATYNATLNPSVYFSISGITKTLYLNNSTFTGNRNIVLFDNGSDVNAFCGFQLSQALVGDYNMDYYVNSSFSDHRFFSNLPTSFYSPTPLLILGYNGNTSYGPFNILNSSDNQFGGQLNLNTTISNAIKIIFYNGNITSPTLSSSYNFCGMATQNTGPDVYMNYYANTTSNNGGHRFYLNTTTACNTAMTISYGGTYIYSNTNLSFNYAGTNPTSIKTINTNLTTNLNSVALGLKANPVSTSTTDASITVSSSSIGSVNDLGTCTIAAGALNLGITSSTINIGTSAGATTNINIGTNGTPLTPNTINIGNSYSNVNIYGSLTLETNWNNGTGAAGVNVNTFLRQFTQK